MFTFKTITAPAFEGPSVLRFGLTLVCTFNQCCEHQQDLQCINITSNKTENQEVFYRIYFPGGSLYLEGSQNVSAVLCLSVDGR